MVGREEARADSTSISCPGCVPPDGLPAAPGIFLPEATKSRGLQDTAEAPWCICSC